MASRTESSDTPFYGLSKSTLFYLQSALLVFLGIWIYYPALHGSWLWDDAGVITENSKVKTLSGLVSIWLHPSELPDFLPIKFTVQWIQWHLWHMDTFGYHLTNLVLHLVSACLLWRLFKRLGLQFAWLGALLFVVHPLMVESVAWISELKNTLSLPPLLFAMMYYLDYDEHPRQSTYIKSFLWFLVAGLCKTSVLMFPFIILLYAWWRRKRLSPIDLKRSAPFFALSLVLGLVTRYFQHVNSLHTGANVMQEEAILRLVNAGLIISFYLWKALMPFNLLPAYPRWEIPPPSFISALPLVFLGLLITLFWFKRITWGRHALFGTCFFLFNLSIFLGFFNMSFMEISWVSDHLVYISLIGLIGLAVAAFGMVYRHCSSKLRSVLLILAGIQIIVFTLQSHAYAGMFRSSQILWTYDLERNSTSFIAYSNLAIVAKTSGDIEEAIQLYRKAIGFRPGDPELHSDLGSCLVYQATMQHDRLGASGLSPVFEAISEYREALRLDPTYAVAHNNLGVVLIQEGSMNEAVAHFKKAIQLNESFGAAYGNLGDAFLKLDRPADAILEYKAALRLNPTDTVSQNNLHRAESMTAQ